MRSDPQPTGANVPTRRWIHGNGSEVTWTAALTLLSATLGYALLPPLLRMLGKSGRIESVEWALFLLAGTALPIAALATAWIFVRARPARTRVVDALAWSVIGLLAARLFWALGMLSFLVSLGCAMLTVAVITVTRSDREGRMRASWLLGAMLAATAVWGSALRLASWTEPAEWMFQSVLTPFLVLAVLGAATVTVAPVADDFHHIAGKRRLNYAIDVLVIVLFIQLSFRTTPVLEFYHWSFWVGPIEAMRQGGWPLWDVPSQYGFMSLLLPSLLPIRDGWQTLYFFQSFLYLINAIGIYGLIAHLRVGIVARLFAAAFTATTFFFRPRDESLFIMAQMTPAGGPMRFLWCYAVLGVLYWRFHRGGKVSDRRFVAVGTAVWIAGVAWSVESAIYTTVTWGGAYAVFLIQRFFSGADGGASMRRRIRDLASGLALPFAAVVATAVVITGIYHIGDGHAPDWTSYYEYAVLFSAGYNALPVAPTGDVWYLVALFICVMAVVVRFIVRDPSNPGLVTAMGAWGAIWSISSYYVSRSHPVNLLSLVPLLVFALVIGLHVLRSTPADKWSRLVVVVAVPLLSMPTVLTLAHGGFPELLFRRQDPVSRLTVQVPAMDSSLAQLVSTARMRPADPIYFVGDGRYLMFRWPELSGGRAETNALGWVPKPYEMISTLSEERRNLYVTRFHRRIRTGGWLIQLKKEINPGYLSLVSLIERSHRPVEKFENDQWIIIRFAPTSAGP